MFLGEFQHSIDDKGRVTLPAKFKDAFADGLVVSKGFENCLSIFTMAQWPREEEKMRAQESLKQNYRMFARRFFASANELVPDKAGRIVIPGALREEAELDKDVYVIGVSDRLEIWAKERWESYKAQADESYEATAEELAK